MRTNRLIQVFTALVAALAMSSGILPAGAEAHRHQTAGHHRHQTVGHHRHQTVGHHRRHHRHAHRHHGIRHARRHHGPRAHAASFAGPSLAAIKATQPTTYARPAITGTIYYVSPTGSDSNSGLSPAQAWRTVRRVNQASVHLQPGDAVLFQGGASYTDDSLQPGWGDPLAGTSNALVTFGAFGNGRATIPQGVWLHNSSYLVIEDLNLGPAGGVEGTGDHLTIQNCSIHDMVAPSGAEVAINARGSNWLIRGNRIDGTGDSGMLIRGDHFRIDGNVIANTGLDHRLSYGLHGIYLKATDSTASGNTIYNFRDDGISVRYRDSIVTNNMIAGGQFGIGWFQYDPVAGTSTWSGNTVIRPGIAGIYVSPSDPAGGSTRESFVITGNRIRKPSRQVAGWAALALKRTSGSYSVSQNVVN